MIYIGRMQSMKKKKMGCPTCQSAVQSGGPRLPRVHRHWQNVSPPVAEEADEVASEASEWDEKEREEGLAEMRVEAERWGGEE